METLAQRQRLRGVCAACRSIGAWLLLGSSTKQPVWTRKLLMLEQIVNKYCVVESSDH